MQNDFPTIRQLDTFCQLLVLLARAGEFDAVAARGGSAGLAL